MPSNSPAPRYSDACFCFNPKPGYSFEPFCHLTTEEERGMWGMGPEHCQTVLVKMDGVWLLVPGNLPGLVVPSELIAGPSDAIVLFKDRVDITTCTAPLT